MLLGGYVGAICILGGIRFTRFNVNQLLLQQELFKIGTYLQVSQKDPFVDDMMAVS